MSQQTQRFLYALAIMLMAIATTFLLSFFGFFKGYAHLLSENHIHRWHTLFRLGFIVVFSIANYYYFIPRFFIQKRFFSYILMVLVALVCMVFLPDILNEPIKPPPHFSNPWESKGQQLPHPLYNPSKSPFVFEMANMVVLFFISTLTALALRLRPYFDRIGFQNEPTNTIIEAQLEKTDYSKETALTVTVNYSLMRIEFSEILFIKSMDNYLQFHFKDKKPILVRMTLKDVTEKLPRDQFLRVHKSFIVAKTAIDNIRNKTVLISEHEIPIGRAYEESVFKVLGK
jgi:hypothetical protein